MNKNIQPEMAVTTKPTKTSTTDDRPESSYEDVEVRSRATSRDAGDGHGDEAATRQNGGARSSELDEDGPDATREASRIDAEAGSGVVFRNPG